MYLEFYGFKRPPFAIGAEDKFFFQSASHSEALANMMYTIRHRKGMVLITGEVGAGKTFVINILCRRLGDDCLTACVANPMRSGKQLVRALANRVGLTVKETRDKLSCLDQLQGHLLRLHHRGQLVALMIDEAQDLSAESLEEIRLLWNWEHQGNRLIQIVLVGQPELRDRLREPRLEPLRQRIVLSYHLGPLSAEDTAAYIAHRLAVAGNGSPPTAQFTGPAVEAIHVATGGIPRLINVLCDNALLVGYVRSSKLIDPGVVAEVLGSMTCWDLHLPQTRQLANA